VSSDTYNAKLAARKVANAALKLLPGPLLRHMLKSIWYQPRFQDHLRFHVEPYRYESAIPTSLDVNRERLKEKRRLPGICFDVPRYLSLLKELKPYADEISSLPMGPTGDPEFWFKNGGYEDLDAVTLYSLVRLIKPKRIIEVGCGFSSRIVTIASRKNGEEGSSAECTFIEPYPPPWIRNFKLPGELMEKKVEDAPLSLFQSLEANDILFIDTTHVLKCQNDCCYELLEIIPSLADGVLIHVHDIFTPYDYPGEWLLDHLRPFNEQYGLECLLTHNSRLEVVLPVYYLYREHSLALRSLLETATTRPAAFWIQNRGAR
jgi:hypothetical protein